MKCGVKVWTRFICFRIGSQFLYYPFQYLPIYVYVQQVISFFKVAYQFLSLPSLGNLIPEYLIALLIVDKELKCGSSLYNSLRIHTSSFILGTNIFLNKLFSNSLNICSSFRARVCTHTKHQVRINCGFVQLIAVFDRRRVDKEFSAE